MYIDHGNLLNHIVRVFSLRMFVRIFFTRSRSEANDLNQDDVSAYWALAPVASVKALPIAQRIWIETTKSPADHPNKGTTIAMTD
jgi:hypothetical protein